MRDRSDSRFKALRELAPVLAQDDDLALIGEYCRLRKQGLRHDALQQISDFIAIAKQWPEDQQQRVADRLMSLSWKYEDAHLIITHQLGRSFLVPVFQKWRESDQSGVAARWLGVLTHDYHHLVHALKLNTGDVIARSRAVGYLLSDVDYACHHLDEGFFIGSEDEIETTLKEAGALLRMCRMNRHSTICMKSATISSSS